MVGSIFDFSCFQRFVGPVGNSDCKISGFGNYANNRKENFPKIF